MKIYTFDRGNTHNRERGDLFFSPCENRMIWVQITTRHPHPYLPPRVVSKTLPQEIVECGCGPFVYNTGELEMQDIFTGPYS